MKKSKVWNDKHYKRMQTVFESQGIKANFDAVNEEEAVLEEVGNDAEMLHLLSQISSKLDGLKDIDTSIDYLVSALSGEHALAIKAKQGMFGRGAPIKPVELKEHIKEFYNKQKA
jgi:CRISPR/Cas system Type II protein with McrA/HNH and RuvC-like nuclease domain